MSEERKANFDRLASELAKIKLNATYTANTAHNTLDHTRDALRWLTELVGPLSDQGAEVENDAANSKITELQRQLSDKETRICEVEQKLESVRDAYVGRGNTIEAWRKDQDALKKRLDAAEAREREMADARDEAQGAARTWQTCRDKLQLERDEWKRRAEAAEKSDDAYWYTEAVRLKAIIVNWEKACAAWRVTNDEQGKRLVESQAMLQSLEEISVKRLKQRDDLTRDNDALRAHLAKQEQFLADKEATITGLRKRHLELHEKLSALERCGSGSQDVCAKCQQRHRDELANVMLDRDTCERELRRVTSCNWYREAKKVQAERDEYRRQLE